MQSKYLIGETQLTWTKRFQQVGIRFPYLAQKVTNQNSEFNALRNDRPIAPHGPKSETLWKCENKSTSKSNIMIEALAQAARRVPPGGKHRPVKVTVTVNIGNDPQVFTQSQYL